MLSVLDVVDSLIQYLCIKVHCMSDIVLITGDMIGDQINKVLAFMQLRF